MIKYLCNCGQEIKTLVCSWDQGSYYGRPVLATSGLYCLEHGQKKHEENLQHSKGKYQPYIDRIFSIHLNASTKEVAVKQILAQVIPSLSKLYLPKTDLKKCLKEVKKI